MLFKTSELFEKYITNAINRTGLTDRIYFNKIHEQDGHLQYLSFIAPKFSHVVKIEHQNDQWELFAQIAKDKSVKKTSKDIDMVLIALKVEIEHR